MRIAKSTVKFISSICWLIGLRIATKLWLFEEEVKVGANKRSFISKRLVQKQSHQARRSWKTLQASVIPIESQGSTIKTTSTMCIGKIKPMNTWIRISS
jgi:hypothetical protein